MLSATCDYYSPASRVNQSQREFPAASGLKIEHVVFPAAILRKSKYCSCCLDTLDIL